MHTSLTDPPASRTADDLERQQAAITRLGHELRALVEATVRTAATPDTLHRVADDVRHLTARLTGRRRERDEIPEVDEFPDGARMYSPVSGTGSPLAAPPHLATELVTADGVFVAPGPQHVRALFPRL